MDERRKFERVRIPPTAKVYVTDRDGKRMGNVRILGRGGLLVDMRDAITSGATFEIMLVDEGTGIRRRLRALARYKNVEGVGFEFEGLEPDAAVEVGVILGRYYSEAAGA